MSDEREVIQILGFPVKRERGRGLSGLLSRQPNSIPSTRLVLSPSESLTNFPPMLVSNGDEPSPEAEEPLEKSQVLELSNSPANPTEDCSGADDESVIDVSGRSMDFSIVESSPEELRDEKSGFRCLYFYKNAFNLIPKSVSSIGRLRTLKFFGNEINIFSSGFGDLVELENLQVRISSPGLGGLELGKLEGLKKLELSKVPLRPSAFPIFREIATLKCLTSLSVCHFSIRYLPAEIGCLKKLEFLDLSFNKMKSLPTEISHLSVLVSLKVANNKLVEIPPTLSLLQKLESLDLSSNRLTSLGSLELGLMHKLKNLNLQFNELLTPTNIPSWMHCNLEAVGRIVSNEDSINSPVEMDVYDSEVQEYDGNVLVKGSHHSHSCLINGPGPNDRSFALRNSGRRWKRRYYLQQRARQERLNNSRKWKCTDHAKQLSLEEDKTVETDVLPLENSAGTSEITGLDGDDKELSSQDGPSENISTNGEDNEEHCSCVTIEQSEVDKGDTDECCERDESLDSVHDDDGSDKEVEDSSSDNKEVEDSSSEIKIYSNTKRHSDKDLDNPKPCKARKATFNSERISRKYSSTSFCGIDDRLPDGFYDAGRNRPFMPLRDYVQSFPIDSREVIVVDRGQDEELDAILLSAQALVFHLKQLNFESEDGDWINELQVASLLALFVSDHFGGSDKSAMIERTRKAVSGSNYEKPFVCTCVTGNKDNASMQAEPIPGLVDNIALSDICEKSLLSIKARKNTILLPLGALQFGVCRHRALLMKYLCDRMEPPIPCELIRGYLNFMPHAWNVVQVKRRDSMVRMIVDACHPHDIREETDPEFYCRYIPLCRGNVSSSDSSFPSLSCPDEVLKASSKSLIRCKYGALEAAAKVRRMEIRTSLDDYRNFEYACLGEVRLLGTLKHSCIVEMYGHQISTEWIPSTVGNPQYRRVLQSAILMEYIKGGSLKGYIEKLSEAGEKRLPVELSFLIARDIASALTEVHSKHVIHRDVKSENVLIDLDGEKPVVKLCDFDRAVPVRSASHTCCIAHVGNSQPNVCVGTPRWMAPEVVRALHKLNVYGVEVDVWSFGCLLLEMLTLQIPYSGLSEVELHDSLQSGKRPRLTDELETLRSTSTADSDAEHDDKAVETETLRFLIDLFRKCTEENPLDRPTAEELYETLRKRDVINTTVTQIKILENYK